MGIRPEGGEFPSFSRGGRYLQAESPGRTFCAGGGLAWYLWAGKTRIGGQRGGALGPQALRTCLRPRGRGCPARSRVPDVPESAFASRPLEALAPPFLKSLILTMAKALRNTTHCWQLPGGLAEL